MTTKPEIAIAILTLCVVVGLAFVRRNTTKHANNETFRNVFPAFKQHTLYWFCESNSNARNWADFGARRSIQPNRGYLELALQRVYSTQSDFSIVPLIGRDAVYTVLPNLNPSAKQLPTKLWREFVIANILSTKGGLVMDGDSTLCVGPSFYPYIQSVDAATFGINPDEPFAAAHTAIAPGPSPYVGWSAAPNHPAWSFSAREYNALVAKGPQAWASALARRMNQSIWDKQTKLGCSVIRSAEGNRLESGKLRQLEDIFGRLAHPNDPCTDIPADTVYISYDGEDLERNFEFQWFLRMSVSQLQQSDIVWSKLARE